MKHTQLVFFDFEMFCDIKKTPFEQMESIRLGAVKYNIQTGEVKYFDSFIKPKFRKKLSGYCKRLTGIKQSDINKAPSFKIVINRFLRWVGDSNHSLFLSWGDNDIRRFKIDAQYHDFSKNFIHFFEKRYVNFQEVMISEVTGQPRSVENALLLYDLSFEGEKHHPTYDAYNTLRIYLSYINEKYKTEAIRLKEIIFRDTYKNYESLIDKIYHYSDLKEFEQLSLLKSETSKVFLYFLKEELDNIFSFSEYLFPRDWKLKLKLLSLTISRLETIKKHSCLVESSFVKKLLPILKNYHAYLISIESIYGEMITDEKCHNIWEEISSLLKENEFFSLSA